MAQEQVGVTIKTSVVGQQEVDKLTASILQVGKAGQASAQQTAAAFRMLPAQFTDIDAQRAACLEGLRVGDEVVVMAGPCSVESEAQVLEVADRVKESGAKILRGGAFKPRTSPYAFQGLEEEGLKLLADARKATGLPVITEVLEPEAPFGESHGYVNLQEYNAFMEVTAITRRRHPILTSFISQVTPSESSVLKKVAMEPLFLTHLRQQLAIKGVRRVVMHEPLSNLRKVIFVQFAHGKTVFRAGVNHREVHLLVRRVQRAKQVPDRVEHLGGAHQHGKGARPPLLSVFTTWGCLHGPPSWSRGWISTPTVCGSRSARKDWEASPPSHQGSP